MKARFPYVATLLMAFSLWGCATDHEVISDDDTLVSDDDVSDDDVSDDDTEENDPLWLYYTTEIRFDAAGSEEGGLAEVDLRAAFHDAEDQVLCHQSFDIIGEYTHGVGHSDELFEYTDQLIVPEQMAPSHGDCPDSLGSTAEDIAAMLEWSLFPLAFVSCDSVADHSELGSMFLAEPQHSPYPLRDLTFESVCEYFGPAASYYYGLGEAEAVWLRPCSDGEFDEEAPIDLVYFVPHDTTHTEAWALSGISLVGAGNTDEPVEGLMGGYDVVTLWPQVFEVDERHTASKAQDEGG